MYIFEKMAHWLQKEKRNKKKKEKKKLKWTLIAIKESLKTLAAGCMCCSYGLAEWREYLYDTDGGIPKYFKQLFL